MSDNWVAQYLENALKTWNEKLSEIWQLITQSPEQFKGGTGSHIGYSRCSTGGRTCFACTVFRRGCNEKLWLVCRGKRKFKNMT